MTMMIAITPRSAAFPMTIDETDLCLSKIGAEVISDLRVRKRRYEMCIRTIR
jgi:hypothetical protein